MKLYSMKEGHGMGWIIAAVAIFAVMIVALFIHRRFGFFAGKVATIETIVGERCIVTETIDNFAGCGQVWVKGQLWSARGLLDDDVFEKGEALRIVAIEGVRVVCKKD